MKKFSTRQIAFVAIMAALVYVTSAFLQIPIASPIGNARLHMGNVMCLLSGFLLGPVSGGLAAGIGSMFFDLTNPAYIASAPFTLIFKFLLAFVCGLIAKGGKERLWALIVGAVLGSLTYVMLYLGKTFIRDYFVLGYPLEGVMASVGTKSVTSVINGIIASVVSIPLYLALKPLLQKAHLLP